MSKKRSSQNSQRGWPLCDFIISITSSHVLHKQLSCVDLVLEWEQLQFLDAEVAVMGIVNCAYVIL